MRKPSSRGNSYHVPRIDGVDPLGVSFAITYAHDMKVTSEGNILIFESNPVCLVLRQRASDRRCRKESGRNGPYEYICHFLVTKSLLIILSSVLDAKLLIGRKYDDAEVQSDLKHFPFRVIIFQQGWQALRLCKLWRGQGICTTCFLSKLLI